MHFDPVPPMPDDSAEPSVSPDRVDAALRRLEAFARWTDDAYRIPFTRYRVGLEPLVGLLPGVGDAAGLIVAAYVPIEAWRLGAPWSLIGRMGATIAVDALSGTVPVLGDVLDVTYKANRRNVDRLKAWLATRPTEPTPPVDPTPTRRP